MKSNGKLLEQLLSNFLFWWPTFEKRIEKFWASFLKNKKIKKLEHLMGQLWNYMKISYDGRLAGSYCSKGNFFKNLRPLS